MSVARKKRGGGISGIVSRMPLAAAAGTWTIAGQVKKYAVKAVPKRTGNLAGSIERSQDGINASVIANSDGTAPYAPHIEYGTKKMKAQSYMRYSADLVRTFAAKIFWSTFRKIIT